MTDVRVGAVCVTGMHRSGTSFAARLLELLGITFGEPAQLMGPGPDNPAGYWENRFVKELDDELLACLGGSWDQPPVLGPGWQHDPALDDYRTRAAQVLDDAFGPESERPERFAWKDPRLSLLLPFWRTVIPIATSIIVVRDPSEVAASLGRRNQIPRPHACLLWLRYLLAASINDPDHLLLLHRDFFEDLPRTLARIAEHLQLDAPGRATARDAQAQLDPTLRHHDRPPAVPSDDDPLTTLARDVWNEGRIDAGILPDVLAQALASGWLRSPTDTEALDRARAKVVELTERLRKRARARKAAATPTDARDADDVS